MRITTGSKTLPYRISKILFFDIKNYFFRKKGFHEQDFYGNRYKIQNFKKKNGIYLRELVVNNTHAEFQTDIPMFDFLCTI